MGRYKSPYTLYKRGRYWYYRTYTPEGLRTAGTSTGKTNKSAAKEFCDNLFLNGQLYRTNVTFKKYATGFYDEKSLYVMGRGKPISPNTLKMYQHNLEHNIMPFFENIKLSDITYSKLLMFRKYLLEDRNLAAGTANLMLSTLAPILKMAFKDDLISRNPFDFIDGINSQNDIRDAYTLDEVILVYQIINNEFKEICAFTAITGLRISEYFALNKSDIKLHKDGYYYIDITKQMYKGKICPPKRNSKRQIPVINEAVENFTKLEYEVRGSVYSAFKIIKDYFEDADDRKLSFHSLRHFFITNSKANNIADVKVEVLAGHSLKGQRKVYTNFKVEDLTDILSWQKETYYKIKKLPKD